MERLGSIHETVVLWMDQLQFWEEYYFEQLSMGDFREIWLNNTEESEWFKSVFVS